MPGDAAAVYNCAGAGLGVWGGALAGADDRYDHNGIRNTLWHQRDRADIGRNVPPSVPFDPGRSHAAGMVPGKLLLAAPVWKRDYPLFQDQKAAVPPSGDLAFVDHISDADRMYVRKLCKPYPDF